MTLPFVACLCPTYGRPRMAANAWACFNAQDYPAERRALLILDDADQLYRGQRDRAYIARQERAPSLPAKYNALVALAAGFWKPDILCVWEDDDLYLPGHVSAHVRALQQTGRPWSHPSRVWSDYPGRMVQEESAGRFHAALAFTRQGLQDVGGWPDTKRADFDQMLMRRLRQRHGPPADPCEGTDPQYTFRWHTGHYHGQGTMRSPDDETWYDRTPAPEITERVELVPAMDDDTRRVYETLAK